MGLTQVETGGVKDNSITSGKILDSEIETSDIKDGAVTTAKLANGAEDGKVLTSNDGSAPTFNTPTVEGVDVKSDGITDTTKFLRADGDNTCSWQTPQGAGAVSTSADGLAPQLPSSHGGKFLKADATWEVPPYPSTVDTTANGLAPILPNPHGGKFLKADGTWQIPDYIANTDTTYNVFSESTDGLVPGTASGGGDSAKFLKGDATWATPTVPDVTTSASGVVAALPSSDATTKFLRGDNTWVVPPDTDTTYSLADITANGLLKILPTDGGSADTTKYLRGDNTWVTPPFLRSDTDDVYEGGNLIIKTESSSGQYWGFNLKYDSGWEYLTTGGYGWAFRNGGTNGFEVRVADAAGTAGQTATTKNFFFKGDGTFHIPNQLYTGSGTSHFGGNININTVYPSLTLNDTNNDSDFKIINSNGIFTINDSTNSADRLTIASDGVVDVAGNLDVGGGLDVTGDITVSGEVDGVDIAKLDALAYCNLNKTSLTEDINEEGIASKVAIRWDNKVYMSETYTHSTTTNPEKVEVGSAGLYMINVNIGHDNTSGGRVNPRASLWKNDTEITETRSSKYGRGAELGDEKSMQINTVLQLASGDHLKVYAWSDYSANYNPAVNTVVGECEFVMTRLAGGVEAEA